MVNLVTRRFADCCLKYPNATFVFNSSFKLTSYQWLNEEIAEFNRIMFELSIELNNMLFFDLREVLMNSPLIPGRVIKKRRHYGGNGCHLTFAANVWLLVS